MKYTNSLLKDVNGFDSVVGLVRMAWDREGWRSMVAHVNEDMASR